MDQSLLDHAFRLRALASRTLGDCLSPQDRANIFTESFRDGAGQIREVDRYLIANLGGRRHLPDGFSETPDILAWRYTHGGTPWVAVGDRGPFASELAHSSIETWTEVELSCLHAMSHLDSRNKVLSPRAQSAARWLMSELQPDNATGRPWAAHVFLFLACTQADVEAAMYADTLIHNTLVAGSGKPEPLSAAILLDGAIWLERMNANSSNAIQQ
jgi:hypothetical protein